MDFEWNLEKKKVSTNICGYAQALSQTYEGYSSHEILVVSWDSSRLSREILGPHIFLEFIFCDTDSCLPTLC